MIVRGNPESNLNISRDEYVAYYDERGGFDTGFNENTHDVDAPLSEIMLKVGRSLVDNNPPIEALWA